MYHQKGLDLFESLIFLKQEIAFRHSVILIQLNMSLYLLLDVFLKMWVFSPEIECSGARIAEIIITSSFNFKALEEIKVFPVWYANFVLRMSFCSDYATMISIYAVQSLQLVHVICVCSSIMLLIFSFLFQRISLHWVRQKGSKDFFRLYFSDRLSNATIDLHPCFFQQAGPKIKGIFASDWLREEGQPLIA